MPYLGAVVNKAVKLRPAVSMSVKEYVLKEGLRIPDSRFFSPSTIVGMNPYQINRNPTVFGGDADCLRPG